MAANTTSRWIGSLVGLAVLAGGVVSVCYFDWQPKPTAREVPIRPLKTFVVSASRGDTSRKYPGRVRANQEVDLAFQVAGPLIELPVKRSDEVEQGQLLARIDPRDFENTLTAKQAVLTRAESDLEKVRQLIERKASTPKELSDAESAARVADAEVRIAAKALDDTYLRAPFAGVIADTFVENFQNVQAKQAILSLQDISSVEVEVNVPEAHVVHIREDREKDGDIVAVFDSLPGRRFPVTLKDFATEADPATQTYAATLVMPAPTDVRILPGMTATVIPPSDPRNGDDATGGFLVPIDAVPVDGLGSYYVWVVDGEPGDAGTVRRVDVAVGEISGDRVPVVKGLREGDRIAAAGVHILQQGRRVRIMVPDTEGGD